MSYLSSAMSDSRRVGPAPTGARARSTESMPGNDHMTGNDESALTRQFDGRPFLALTLWNTRLSRVHRVVEIAYELGYRLVDVSVLCFTIHVEFRRDDAQPARVRAREADDVLSVGGTIPEAVPSLPSGIASREAARARYALAAAHSDDARLLGTFLLAWCATVLLVLGGALAAVAQRAGYVFLVLGAILTASLTAAQAARPFIERRQARCRELLERCESERDAAC